MNTNMAGFRWFSKFFAFFGPWKKVASALDGLRLNPPNGIYHSLVIVFAAVGSLGGRLFWRGYLWFISVLYTCCWLLLLFHGTVEGMIPSY